MVRNGTTGPNKRAVPPYATTALALLMMTLLGACSSPGVSGVVLPSKEDRSGLPGKQRAVVRLIRGRVAEDLAQLAGQLRQDAVKEARQRVLEAAKAEQVSQDEAAQRIRTALADAEAAGSGDNQDGAVIRACLPRTEAKLATAKGDQLQVLKDLVPRLTALGISTNSPTQAVTQLRALQQSKIDAEAQRLRDEYLRSALVQKSGAVLALAAMDRLCWNGENKRDLALRFRGPVVSYNGKALPDSIAQQIWGLPTKGAALPIPNAHAASDVLLPGASFEACFYARGTQLPLETSQAYGLATSGPPSRSGEWTLQWQDIALVADPAAQPAGHAASDHHVAEVPLTSVFASQLHQFEAASEEGRLIEALNNSDSARELRQAEAALLACHRAIELQKKQDEVERVIQAIEGTKKGEQAVDVRVRPILQTLLRDPDRLARWIDTAGSFVDSRAAARQDMFLGQDFKFTDVAAGQYSLLGEFPSDSDKPKLWLIPIDVQRPITQDLTAAMARDTTLRGAFETIWLNSSR
ncbi:MAG TPA: hypothetical protein VMT89_04665 [Candidatus Acidoferrales bacterium]|nr:hypothetical protein [Candidatus Acidoferrales bacterium]